ncbi:MAG: ribosome biogenesis GTPase YlqF [Eubacteriales bacterium]|nr:ribosome biogenesis GTPase YlqF [Eubacteriales bacterium]
MKEKPISEKGFVKTDINWFPGHMAKTRRLMAECLSDVDILIEVLDARIPYSSRNPEIKKIANGKPVLTVLNKSSLSDSRATDEWCRRFEKNGESTLRIDCISGQGIDKIPDTIRAVLSEKVERYNSKGMSGRHLRAMIVGIPNVGKSSLINRLAEAKRAKVEDRPGVTTSKQWISTSFGLDLLDMPGVLWPKFGDKTIGENLAITGAIKDAVLNIEEIAMLLCERLRDRYPALLCDRYKLCGDEISERDGYDIFNMIGEKRGFLMRGGVINELRTAQTILDEFRGGVIGRITLDDIKSLRS